MENFFKKLWSETKSIGGTIGFIFLILGLAALFVLFGLVISGTKTDTTLLGISLGLISVGLGFIAIGMATQSDKRHTDLLKSLDRNVARLPTMFKDDILTPSGQLIVKEMASEQSKIATQKRLDEDTERVGYVRGEIYQLDDGSWAIHWGGKYPL